MALIDIWRGDREQLDGKHIQQIIAFAGDGQLRDGSRASEEFRQFLSSIPSSLLRTYCEQCLESSFGNSGLALQDIINEAGRRLVGPNHVTWGRYRGAKSQIGFDGIWILPAGHAIVVEVKTTDAYRIDLNTIATYRRSLIGEKRIEERRSSILIVVGRTDTGDLEEQIRGSRHAWDVRLISADALMRLMRLKEDVDDPQSVQRIHEILIPREFTKLDGIVELVFSTAEDVKNEELPESDTDGGRRPVKPPPASFNQECVGVIEKRLGKELVRRSRTTYSSTDGSLALVCTVSRQYDVAGVTFWYAFHAYQKEFLENAADGYVGFGCGSKDTIVLLPWGKFSTMLDDLNRTERADRVYWHVHIYQEGSRVFLRKRSGVVPVDVSEFLISGDGATST